MWTLCGPEVRQFRSSVRQAINDVLFGAAGSYPTFEPFDLVLECSPSGLNGTVTVRVHTSNATGQE